jgi:DNA repair protein RadA/Sms
MAKPRSVYVCQECGHEAHKWQGKCSACGAWNSLVEEVRGGDDAPKPSTSQAKRGKSAEPLRLGEVDTRDEARRTTGTSEFDRVLGGGFVSGSVVLLGGDPGIGKSTLSLQVAGAFASRELEVLYLTGEESLRQLRMRADRLDVEASDVQVVLETTLERADTIIRDTRPDLLIIDSIQTLATERLTSSPGSVAQLREVTGAITQLAKGLDVPTILIGHVTKEGAIAGPKVLEHMVDTVLYFEGQSGSTYRVLRAVKNRYGSTNEIGVFEMRGDGLREVTNPSAIFLEERPEGASGSVVVPIVEGSRPLLVEVQALLSPSAYGPPRVTTIGVEQSRSMLLLNIIDKRTDFQLAGHDVFVNVAGGVRVVEPAVDLGVAAAMLSSMLDRSIDEGTIVFGELGLAGEVRAVARAPSRLLEAQKLGFERAVLPAGSEKSIREYLDSHPDTRLPDMELAYVRTVMEACRSLFGPSAG